MKEIAGYVLNNHRTITMGQASKKYEYDYDDYEDGKDASTMIEEILNDSELSSLNEIVIGYWGDPCDEGIQPLIDGIVESETVKKQGKFSHIKSLFVGDIDMEDCEVSWITQGNYSGLWAAMPNLLKFGVRGSQDLELGEIVHENLKELDIICGGLGKSVIASIRDAKLPSLESITLYFGIMRYGFDGEIKDIKDFLDKSDFPNLKHLGLEDSEIQDEITEAVFNSKYISQIESLSLANGTLTDKGGQIILDKLKDYPNIKEVNLHHHYLSDDMFCELQKLGSTLNVKICLSEQQEIEEFHGKPWLLPILTE